MGGALVSTRRPRRRSQRQSEQESERFHAYLPVARRRPQRSKIDRAIVIGNGPHLSSRAFHPATVSCWRRSPTVREVAGPMEGVSAFWPGGASTGDAHRDIEDTGLVTEHGCGDEENRMMDRSSQRHRDRQDPRPCATRLRFSGALPGLSARRDRSGPRVVGGHRRRVCLWHSLVGGAGIVAEPAVSQIVILSAAAGVLLVASIAGLAPALSAVRVQPAVALATQ